MNSSSKARFSQPCYLPYVKAETTNPVSSPDSFETLKKEARKSESPDDWKRVINNAQARKDTADLGFAYASYLQAMANMSPAGFKEEARPIMTFLLDTRQYDYYFALYNLLISRLFSDQAYRHAQMDAELLKQQRQKEIAEAQIQVQIASEQVLHWKDAEAGCGRKRTSGICHRRIIRTFKGGYGPGGSRP